MRFSITGWLGVKVTLTWEDGKLVSDSPLLPVIQQIIEDYEKSGYVLQEHTGGVPFEQDVLAHPYSAYLILTHILSDIEEAPNPDDLREDLPKYTSEGLMDIHE